MNDAPQGRLSSPTIAWSHGHDPDAQASFATLIGRLALGGSDSAVEYERLRRRLVVLLRRHEPVHAEALADVALDRLARHLNDGTAVDDPCGYVLGIARKLVMEAGERRQREQRMFDDPSFTAHGSDPDHADERLLAVLGKCLDRLSAAQREFILAYYNADGAARIEDRQRLARADGVSLNALRNRALRLREALERCARQALAGGLARDETDVAATQDVPIPNRGHDPRESDDDRDS